MSEYKGHAESNASSVIRFLFVTANMRNLVAKYLDIVNNASLFKVLSIIFTRCLLACRKSSCKENPVVDFLLCCLSHTALAPSQNLVIHLQTY